MICGTRLFNGEYFFHEADPKHPESQGSYNGCEYSQLLGQSQAYQVGLGEIVDPAKVTTALNSLWKYNFSTDVGLYREKFQPGRWYAMPGEAGLIACTWPHGAHEVMKRGNADFSAYLNECQVAYEYGCTSLMIWQGLVDKGLAHFRAVHERYDGAKRNPWNEVECGSHYSRSMASYGLFTAICGFECDGPLGYLAFAPRLAPENFKCAFTSAEGWGSFAQTVEHGVQKATITLKWGRLRLKEIVLAPVGAKIPATAKIAMDGRKIPCSFSNRDGRLVLTLSTESTLVQDQILVIEMQ